MTTEQKTRMFLDIRNFPGVFTFSDVANKSWVRDAKIPDAEIRTFLDATHRAKLLTLDTVTSGDPRYVQPVRYIFNHEQWKL